MNGQKEISSLVNDTSVATTPTATSAEVLVQKLSAARLKVDQSSQQQTVQNNKGSKLVQQMQDLKVNGIVQNGEQCHSENDEPQREAGTPASTISSSEDSSANHQVERLAESSEETNSTAILG
jgi:hypothetical protein